MEEQIDTEDFGEKQVQIVPIGKFVGSSLAGEPVQEEIDKQSLEQLAVKLNDGDEVLCDIDHQSCKVGAGKDTSAAGWFSRFVVDPIRGLLATLKFTKKGRDLAQSREYRYLSPALSFKDGKVDDLHSVSFTNTPAFKDAISPIINSAPAEQIQETITMEITKEELAEMIKQAVKAELEAAEVAEEAIDEQPAKEAEEAEEEAKEEVAEKEAEKKEEVEETKVEETKVEEPKVEETKVEETKVEETAKEDEKKEEDKKEEVIKIEVLNSAPDKTPEICKNETPVWQDLKGKEFFDWLKAHPECR